MPRGNDDTNGPTDLYGYIPSKTIAVIFLGLFLITTFTHLFQAIKYRHGYKFMLLTAVLCGVIELLGWSGRIWSAFNSVIVTPYQIQISCTIIAPTPLLAANFVIFGRIIRKLGAGYSRLRPRLYTIIFACSDVISLVVQAFGAGLASSASTHAGSQTGSNIMLAGIVFQLMIIVLYATCLAEFVMRYRKHRPAPGKNVQEKRSEVNAPGAQDAGDQRGEMTPQVMTMIVVLCLTTTLLFIRAVYRVAELADGWSGRIIRTQVYFNVLDATMVIIVMYATNIFHPGRLLAEPVRGPVDHFDSNAQSSETESV
ncbi:hypothetical protein D9619_012895 [Psilocybe cf. subviscida]|uniref:RTA1-domain-containing protein n=1 Tax=Psilocybe cf. subviscida TaxID=2480587 RepID=A0A8H5BKD7_9AGAR|nr:hypothetical protein D9619_012895 [Psilocybe cf. subviscida]